MDLGARLPIFRSISSLIMVPNKKIKFHLNSPKLSEMNIIARADHSYRWPSIAKEVVVKDFQSYH